MAALFFPGIFMRKIPIRLLVKVRPIGPLDLVSVCPGFSLQLLPVHLTNAANLDTGRCLMANCRNKFCPRSCQAGWINDPSEPALEDALLAPTICLLPRRLLLSARVHTSLLHKPNLS